MFPSHHSFVNEGVMIGRVSRVLVVDADPELRARLTASLVEAGHDVAHTGTGEQALALARVARPDIVIFDLALPDMLGVDLCRALRAEPRRPSLCVLTAAQGEADRVGAFEAGVDDYVTKPHSTRELVLRLRSLVRRRSSPPPASLETLTLGALHIDRPARRVEVAGRYVETTRRELDVLLFLVERAGRVQTRDVIVAQVWGEAPESARVVDTTIKRLRKKLGAEAPAIRTVRGVGYTI